MWTLYDENNNNIYADSNFNRVWTDLLPLMMKLRDYNLSVN